MEHVIWIVALMVTGPLVGLELGVAAVVNPLAAQLPDSGFRVVRSGGSRWLGRLMPVWYLATLVLLLALVVTSGGAAAIAATVVLGLAVVLTVTILVPINTRVGRWESDADVDRALTRRWDAFHWLRVTLLGAVLVLVGFGA
ncbi:MAG: DUF1772 domain-containing protein [Mycobacterium sp.]